MKPIIGIVMGDASGVGPEVTVKALAAGAAENGVPLVIGDRRTFNAAQEYAGLRLDPFPENHDLPREGASFLDLHNLEPQSYRVGKPSPAAARAATEALIKGLDLLKEGRIHALVFGPLDKKVMREAGQRYADEHEMFADYLGLPGQGDAVNVLDDVWAGRVTSHIPLKDVSAHLSPERILLTIRRIHHYLCEMGTASPRIAVAAFNPHCGENGTCGREEIDCIMPAVRQARHEGMRVTGPVSADVVCIRTFINKEFDGIVSMFHDQAQIGIKLLASRRSVTVTGGIPYPVCTTSHGTGYDLAGTGTADSASLEQALRTAIRLVRRPLF